MCNFSLRIPASLQCNLYIVHVETQIMCAKLEGLYLELYWMKLLQSAVWAAAQTRVKLICVEQYSLMWEGAWNEAQSQVRDMENLKRVQWIVNRKEVRAVVEDSSYRDFTTG